MSVNGRKAAFTAMPPLAEIFQRRQILITGATGFLGKVLLFLLLRHHPEIERIYLLIRGDRRSSQNRLRREILESPVMDPLRAHLGADFDRYVAAHVTVVPGDVTDAELVTADDIAHDQTLDAVVHCAGLVNFDAALGKALAINTLGVANVIEFCRRHGAALMHVSSCYTAGVADGHRFEDDLPLDWVPNGRPGFDPRREIKDALAATEQVQEESREAARQADFQAAAGEDPAVDEEHRTRAAELLRKQWVEERLKTLGRERALGWGWPNTYSYTKSLGEQLVVAARGDLAATIVRPSVIESALTDPLPGWNQGVNTSAPLSYMAERGYRFYPARGDLVLDVIPVDLVAHAMIPILAALILRRHQPIYQLCTSDVNPLPMWRLVELTALGHRTEHRRHGGPLGKLAPHLEAVVVSRETYEFASGKLPGLMKQAVTLAKAVAGDRAGLRKVEASVDHLAERTTLARALVEVYQPYIQELCYTFHGAHVRALYQALAPADRARHPYHPEAIAWFDYWINVHLPGLRRHIFPQLELHTRTRPRANLRYRTLTEMLDRVAERHGSAIAIEEHSATGEPRAISFRELREAAARGASRLRRRGIAQNDRVLLIAASSADWIAAYFAILCAGAVAVPLDDRIAAEELASICRSIAPKVALFTPDRAADLGPVVHRVTPNLVQIAPAELCAPATATDPAADLVPPERQALASIIFTAGATGAAKAVPLTHGNLCAQLAMLGRALVLERTDVALSLVGPHDIFGLVGGLLWPLASGCRLALADVRDDVGLTRAAAATRPTMLFAAPSWWENVYRKFVGQAAAHGPFFHAGFDRLRDLSRRVTEDYRLNAGPLLFHRLHAALGGRLKLALSGGAPLPQRVTRFFHDLGIRLLEGYGLAEAAGLVSLTRPEAPFEAGSAGPPLGGIEIKLADADQTGGLGEILIRGATVMNGYLGNPAATEQVLRDGWLHTGDIGRLDAGGRLQVAGRTGDLIAQNGAERIFANDLEQAYRESPFIRDLAAVRVRDGDRDSIALLIVPAYARGESRHAVEAQLHAHCASVSAELGASRRVTILQFTDHALPRTSTGKIKRNEVAVMLERLRSSPSVHAGAATIDDLELDGRVSAADRPRDDRTIAPLPSYARLAEPYVLELPAPVQRLGAALVRRGFMAAFAQWLKPRVMGRGNIPANRNLLVVANLASHLDFGLVSYALGAIGRELVVLAARDYFFNNDLRRFVMTNFTRLIPLDRERAERESLDAAVAEIAAGRSVLIFPEGTRSPDGAIHTFKRAVGYLALRARCDVLPLHLRGTYAVLGKGGLIPRRAPVEVRIGRAIAHRELLRVAAEADGARAYQQVADRLRHEVMALGEQRDRRRAVLPASAGNEAAGAKPPRVKATPNPPDDQTSARV